MGDGLGTPQGLLKGEWQAGELKKVTLAMYAVDLLALCIDV